MEKESQKTLKCTGERNINENRFDDSFFQFLDGLSTPKKLPSNPGSSQEQASRPVRGATIGNDGGILASFSKMAENITELHKLLLDERVKNEKLFQENFGLKMEIENLRTIERGANSKAIVSETIVDNSAIEKAEYPSNKDALSPVDQQQSAHQSGNSQIKKKKKKKNKRSVNKPTRGNVTDGETVHQPADRRVCLSDPNSSSAPAMSSTTHNKSNNNHSDASNSNHSDANKVGTALHCSVQSSSASALPPPPAVNNNINNNSDDKNIRNEVPQPKSPECWKKNTVLIVGDSMLKNINEWTLSKRYTTKVRCFRGSTVGDLHDYIKPLLRKRPDKIILIIGTNDIENKAVADVLKGIKSLLDMILEKLPNCHVVVSEIIKRAGKCKANTNGKINEFNSELKKMNIDILRQQNILPEHINQSGLHLNQHGDGQLARNIISKIRSFSSL